ncbi:MAG: hypothetical protein IJI43_02485 [Bacilli bacterium]|nr:hypothetical protein [Bacilli bacterium]
MKLYLITGKAETGKSALGEYLKEELKNREYEPCIMQVTYPLYHYAEDYFEWDKKSNAKPREFLQNLGVEIIQNKLNKKDFLIKRLMEDMDILKEFFDTFIITDIRFQKEIDNLKKKYNSTVIKVERENYINTLTNKEKKHITETEVDSIKNVNYLVKNSGLKKLKAQAKEIVELEEDK